VDIAIDLIILMGLLALGVPIPFCFMAAVLFLIAVHGFSFEFLLPISFFGLNSLTLLSVPFFIMAGGLMGSSGIAERLVKIGIALVGRFRGGLGGATIVATAIFGAIAGLCSAAVAAIGSIMIPRMEAEGYPRGYATGLVTVSSVLAQLIPPSVPMILYAWVTRLSVASCFLATIGPGAVSIFLYCIINWWMCRKIPSIKVYPKVGLWQQTREVGQSIWKGTFSLMGALIIVVGIYGGFTTPTEAATLAVLYTVFVGFVIYRTLSWRELGRTLFTTATTSGVVILMLFFVMMLSRIYTMLNVPQRLIKTMTGISDNYYVILIMVNVFLVIIGMLMDDFSGTLLAAPLLLPLMRHIGVNPYHFAAILGTNLGLGNVTPPCAPILYLGGRMANCPFDKMIGPASAFMIFGSIPVILITTYWPGLALFLPRLIMGIE
jgi:tripartite ATP-independent transporter DctM subunit